MKKIIAFALFSAFAAAAFADAVESPNGKLVIDVTCPDGVPTYEATYWGVPFLLPSPLGLSANVGDYTKGMTLVEASEPVAVNDSYSLPNSKKSHFDYAANQRVFTFAKDGKPVMEVVFNVADTSFGLKYRLLRTDSRKSAMIDSEATGFRFPDGTTTFLCPQAAPMSGWERTMPSYETLYELEAPMGTNGRGYGFTFPCLFHIGNNEGWALISETGVDGHYCASHLDNLGGSHYAFDYPEPEEMNGMGHAGAAITLPGETPWRTVQFGHTLRPIINTQVQFDLVQPLYEASQPYDYGKGTWSWIIKMDPSCNFDTQKEYIDFAADLGYETVLVDALWDTQIGYDRIEELARYGKEKGVDLYLWYNSNGEWNDAPQGPRGKLDRSRQRRQEMAWMRDNGIRGIKVDFFGGDKQQMMQLYEDILSDANDYGLMVILHGCTLPRGWERMFPNYVASEAVLASENLHFDQMYDDLEALNATLHPLIRNTVGSMDFGGSALNKYYNADNEIGRGNKRMTSDVFALATAIMFQSAVQHFALAPNNLTDAPDWAIDFMKNVPTTWDDLAFIDGYPGKYLAMARQNGDNWYIAAINAQDEPYKKKLQLPMLQPGETVTLYSDDKNLQGSVRTVKVDKKQEIEVNIPTNGALVITTVR